MNIADINNGKRPPRLAEWLIHRLSWADDREAILDNMQEDFAHHFRVKGRFSAQRWYWQYVFRSIWPCMKSILSWRINMFKNHMKIAFRHFYKHMSFSLINILGLAIGLACCMLIMAWVQDELNYDSIHAKRDHIQCITHNSSKDVGRIDPSLPAPLIPYLKDNFADIRYATRFRISGKRLFSVGDKRQYEEKGGFVDPEFFDIFTAPSVANDPKAALKNLNTIVLTENMAKRYFGADDPVGKVIKLENQFDFMVGAIVEDCPPNSSLQYDFLLQFENYGRFDNADIDSWGLYLNFHGYVMLNNSVDSGRFSNLIKDVLDRDNPENVLKLKTYPFSKLRLYGFNGDGSFVHILVFSGIGLLILLMACINFVNLTTAQSAKRAKEIGLRKVSGADKHSIRRQIYSELLVIVTIAFILAIILAVLLLPALNALSGKSLSINLQDNYLLIFMLMGIAILTAFISGLYPAIYFSSFSPMRVFNSASRSTSTHSGLRKFLVLLQFTVSIILIISTLVINKQMTFIRTRELGFDKSHLVYIDLNGNLRSSDRFVIKNELLRHADVNDVTIAQSLPNYAWNTTGSLDWEGKPEHIQGSMPFVNIDKDYFKTVGIEFIDGKTFNLMPSNREVREYIINEKALEYMGIDNPVGKSFQAFGAAPGRIVGVVKNVHNAPLYEEIYPVVYMQVPYFYHYIIMNINTRDMRGIITHIQDVVEDINPDYPFECHFLDETIDHYYQADRQVNRLITYFAALAVFISCLGLLGLSLFMVQQRTREIGIRKTLGASVSVIVGLVSRDFLIMVLISNLMAWPVAYLFMRKWLQNFAYKAELNIGVFLLAAMIGFTVAFLTISFHSIKAARANLVESLRYE
ncbi:ABC transporter permease [bacterium]|nr:ABC transporter permease [bacterium]